MFYGAYYYGKTGVYPQTRQAATATIHEAYLAEQLLQVTNNISIATKPEQKVAIESALTLTPKILTS